MPFNTAIYRLAYGTVWWKAYSKTYCVNNTSASDYGKCYDIDYGKAIFVQEDTATYPVGSLPCEVDKTCTRYTSRTTTRSFGTVFNYSGKQGIVQYFVTRSHSPFIPFNYRVTSIAFFLIIPTPNGDPDSLWFFPSQIYDASSWPIYDPVANFSAYLDPYLIASGHVAVLRWHGIYFTSTLYISAFERNFNNVWYAADISISWTYESSPLAVIPLDYDRDYMPYQELRNAFGYATTGVDQPGWNADDIIRVLRELFPDRAWAVFDDRQYMLYLYNLTPDYVPDWLIDKLSPTAMKVLKAPSDALIARAWLDKLSIRNS